MDAPKADRPYMPGYGVAGPDQGSGPAVNATVSVQPRWVFGLRQDDFSGSPTRWVFDQGFDQGPESFPAAETLE